MRGVDGTRGRLRCSEITGSSPYTDNQGSAVLYSLPQKTQARWLLVQESLLFTFTYILCLQKKNILWKAELQQMYYSYGIDDCVHFLQFSCFGSGLSALSSLALSSLAQVPAWLNEAISRWLSVFYCLWADLSAHKDAAHQSHPHWPSVSLVQLFFFHLVRSSFYLYFFKSHSRMI